MSDDLLTIRRFKALTDEWTSEELGRFFGIAELIHHNAASAQSFYRTRAGT